jgi:Rrf2 family protein
VRLSKRTEYGLRAIIQLAQLEPNVYIQSRHLSSGREQLPAKFLEAVLGSLRQAGVLISRAGSKGGFRLAKPPGEINIGQVIRHLEERLAREDEPRTSDMTPGQIACRLLNDKLNHALERALNGMTLDELMTELSKSAQLQETMYYI